MSMMPGPPRFFLRQHEANMDVKYINPVIESVRSVFATMVHLELTLGQPHIASDRPTHDVSGIVGLSGDVVGSIVLGFPGPVAAAVVSKFAGSDLAVGTEDFADALGELANMIAGSAKSRFEGKSVSISTPSVVVGQGHIIARPIRSACIALPCMLSCGTFSIDIAICEEPQPTRAAA